MQVTWQLVNITITLTGLNCPFLVSFQFSPYNIQLSQRNIQYNTLLSLSFFFPRGNIQTAIISLVSNILSLF